jgi:hypothetical protein
VPVRAPLTYWEGQRTIFTILTIRMLYLQLIIKNIIFKKVSICREHTAAAIVDWCKKNLFQWSRENEKTRQLTRASCVQNSRV